MKKLSVSIALVLLMCTAFVSANELKPKKTYSNVSSELATLLAPDGAVGDLENETVVKVKIRINADNEIVVLQTNTTNAELSNYIKVSLNYKKLSSFELGLDKEYVFDVNFQM
ncbi:hypothetical protein [Flavobacterium ovatum]|uniref:hypothetical protein n=1 Tax=Flavobacterium ovatum TaxID=1928857 RepID=UPI00344D6A99